MSSSSVKTFSKERVKARMLKKAADLWGYSEAEMDAFDPLVGLLVEACSVEFEKIAHEIHTTQSRVLDRLADLMNPDLNTAHPAYGVLRVRGTEPRTIVQREAQLVFKKPNAGRTLGAESIPDLFFSPARPFPVVNGAVKALVHANSAFFIENGNQKVSLGPSGSKTVIEPHTLWIGLELDNAIDSLGGLSFYFDWQNQPYKEIFYQYLPLSRWFLGERALKVRPGLNAEGEEVENQLEYEFDVSWKFEHRVMALFNPCFMTVESVQSFSELGYTRQKYPPPFEAVLSGPVLKQFREELIWVRVQFPASLEPEALTNVYCAINSFPVLNRRLHRLTYRLQQHLNIIPLESDESFLAVKDVRNPSNVSFKSLPLVRPQELEAETYTLQYGVGRFDNRDAKELLYYLLDVLRDESQAFAAMGEDFLSSIIREFNQNIARLEQKITQDSGLRAPVPYAMIKPKNVGENVYVSYWTTGGEVGNRIAAGSRLALYADASLQKNETYLLTATFGGKARLKATEKTNAYKRALLTRNRIVTFEDIRITCLAELGTQVSAVKVEKGFIINATPGMGFVRCIQVRLVPSDVRSLTAEEWERTCEELQMILSTHSVTNVPYRVSLNKL
jgi:hypothetical protein